jgi:SAM-dependent methyltransferase
MTDPYAVDARFYDLLHPGGREDVGLWLSFAGRSGQPVLEAGCGTGRIALELARAGHDVTGIDPSAAMLARARERAEDDGVDVELLEGRVLDLVLAPDRYGLVLVPADVFLYCETGGEQAATLRALGECLHFNGVLALDLPGPALWLDPAENGRPLLAFSGETPAGEQLDAWQVFEDDLAAQVRHLRVTYEVTAADGSLRRYHSAHRLRYVYPFELAYLLERAGLAHVDLYGDYDLGPLTNDSERMIAVARRSAG